MKTFLMASIVLNIGIALIYNYAKTNEIMAAAAAVSANVYTVGHILWNKLEGMGK